MGTAGGFALVVMPPMPVGKQVFLLGIGAIPIVMRGMTPAVTTVKKTAVGGKKSPADAGKKTAALEKPLPGPPQRAGAPSGNSSLGFPERRRYKPIIYYVPYPFRLPHV